METDKSNIERAIEKTKNLLACRKGFKEFSTQGENNFYTFYAATNENLEYFADLNVEGRDALTVTGSGDHALNLAYFGAKTIASFDVNELANIYIAFD